METALEDLRNECWQFLATEKRIGAHLAYADALGKFAEELWSLRAKVLGRATQIVNEVDGVRA